MRLLLSYLAGTVVFVAAIGAACSNAKPEAAGDGSQQQKRAGGTSGDEGTSTGDDDVDTDGKPKLGGSAGGTTPGDGGTQDDGSGCGSGDIEQTIQSAEVRFHGFAGDIFSSEYNVIVKSSLSFRGGASGLVTESRFDVLSADPPNAADKANEEIRKVTGSRTTTPGDSQGMPCGVYPVSRLVEQTGTHATTVEFTPPLPYFVSPLMSKERFAQEFATSRTFSGLALRVLSTTNPKISSGQSVTGSVTISPVSPIVDFTDTEGRPVRVNAQYAFKIEYDFGSHEMVNAFGLYKVATFYVSDGLFHVITIETGIPDAPLANYIRI